MIGISEKKSKIMKDIRNQINDTNRKKIRKELIHSLGQQELDEIINTEASSINEQTIRKLIKFAEEKYRNAIYHLGNLVIDEIIPAARLQNFKINNDIAQLWLAEVLAENHICRPESILLFIKIIKDNSEKKQMEYSLRILYRLVSECEENQIKQYFNDPNVFLAVMNNCLKLDKGIYNIAYMLLAELVIKNIFTLEYNKNILLPKFEKIMINSLVKNQNMPLISTLKSINHLANLGHISQSISLKLHKSMLNMTYSKLLHLCAQYWFLFVNNASEAFLLNLVEDGLIYNLKQLFKLCVDETKTSEMINQVLDTIRIRGSNFDVVEREMKRLDIYNCFVTPLQTQ